MKKLMLICAIAPLFLTTGCATGQKLSELPSEQIQIDSDQSQIVFYRTQVFGAGVQPTIYVDDQPTGKCAPKGVFLVDVTPGIHNILASTETDSNVQVDVSATERLYIRCSIGIGLFVGRAKLDIVDEKIGKSESDMLSFTGKYRAF